MISYLRHVGIAIALLVAGTASAQPAPPAPPAANPTSPEPGGDAPATEPVFAPEHVPATSPPAEVDEPITVDRIVIASTARVDLNFFGDVSLLTATGQDPGFAIGPLGFQVTAHLAEGLVGRSEFALSYENGGTIVDLERAYLEYRTSHWTLAAGRTHAEFGYWNNAFHHGRWLQLTINRPHVLRFEDEAGMLPVHQVGVNAVYGPQRGEPGIELAVGVGNGHGRVLEDIQTGGDNNPAKSILARLGAVGIGHPALRFGVNLGFDTIAPEPAAVRPLAPDVSIVEIISGVYVALRAERLLVYSEVYNVLHRAIGSSWQVSDGFFLLGYRFGKLTPYGQIELRHGDGATDPFYHPAAAINSQTVPPLDYVEGIAGLHVDLNSWSALKLELTARNQDSGSDYRFELNWSFGR